MRQSRKTEMTVTLFIYNTSCMVEKLSLSRRSCHSNCNSKEVLNIMVELVLVSYSLMCNTMFYKIYQL
jgi:hypothetical protein